MIHLYTWATPNGRKASVMLEELGLPYETHPINISKDEQFAPDFLAIAPNNRIPAIVDEDVMQWLMWQMGGLGPMVGQAHHFLFNPKEVVPYGQKRYHNETKRLYGVLDKQLASNEYVAGDAYSIADIAIYPWISRFERHQVDLNDFPNVKRWFDLLSAREAVQRGMAVPFAN